MSLGEIEPLDPQSWFAELKRLERDVASSGAAPVDTLIRRAFYLIQLAPTPLQSFVGITVTELELESWLGVGATLSAAFALMGVQAEIGLERARMSGSTASVRLYGLSDRQTDASSDPARALMGAWCKALLLMRAPRFTSTKGSFGQSAEPLRIILKTDSGDLPN